MEIIIALAIIAALTVPNWWILRELKDNNLTDGRGDW